MTELSSSEQEHDDIADKRQTRHDCLEAPSTNKPHAPPKNHTQNVNHQSTLPKASDFKAT